MMKFRKKMLLSGAALLATFIALLFLFLDAFLSKSGMTGEEIGFFVGKFKIAIVILGGGFLFLYSLSTWFLFNRMSRPLQQITDHILSYTEGNLGPLDSIQKGEFSKIASILNAISAKIKKQMDHLILTRKETEEILETLSEGVVAVDTEGKTTFANESACKVLGISRQAIVSNPLNQIEASQKELVLLCFETIQDVLQTSEIAKQTWAFENQARVHLELTAAPLPGQRGVVLVIQDKSLDFKVLEMGKNFIANASHELRTPITIIRGFAETLQDHPKLSPQTLREISEKIVRTSQRLENLVKSLLTLADIENFSVDQFQTIDLVSIAEHCKQFAKITHLQAKICFTPEEDQALIRGDSHLLDLAVMNLLENAVRYSSSCPQINMMIRKSNGNVELSIQDVGIGISESDLPYIFDRFYTVDKARSRKSGGAGLGLSIVKTIIENHMGYLGVASQLGKGTTVTIHLPLAKPGP